MARVLVTGGASGLGAATVRRLHADGAAVVILDLPSSDGAALADELGERAVFVPADVTDEAQVGLWKTWHFKQYPLVAQEMWGFAFIAAPWPIV